MKVGTDGVLLGAWCRILPTDKAILDIGTGTGVIALQLAQRTERYNKEANAGTGVIVEAVEIDPAACCEAGRNFDASGWGDRLKPYCMPVQDFARLSATDEAPGSSRLQTGFDHIVSNPPFFADSLLSPDPSRNTARHTGTLSYDELISTCDKLLKPAGRISMILPAGAEAEKMIAAAGARGFVVSHRTEVHSTPKSGAKRSLLEFSREHHMARLLESEAAGKLSEPDALIIEDAGPGSFSAEYRTLTRDFYLYF